MFLAVAGTPSLAENVGPATVGTPITNAVADTTPELSAAPTAVEIDYLGSVKTLLKVAEEACEDDKTFVHYDTKEDTIASCRAKTNIENAYWDAMFQKSISNIGVDEAGNMTELANAEVLRDKARTTAATTAGELAKVTAANMLADAVASNALAAKVAEGALAAAKAEIAVNDAGKPNLPTIPTVEVAEPTITSEIQALKDVIAESVKQQKEFCDRNQNISWCN